MTTEEIARVAERLSDLSERIERLEEAVLWLFGPHPTVGDRLAEMDRRRSG